jgi:hypothetical protein
MKIYPMEIVVSQSMMTFHRIALSESVSSVLLKDDKDNYMKKLHDELISSLLLIRRSLEFSLTNVKSPI